MRAVYYHGIVDGPPAGDYYARNFIGPDAFRAHVAELARHWAVLSLAEIDARLAAGRRLPPTAVHLSFDDGFASTILAAEILDAAHLPWTLFVIADALVDRYRPAYIRLADAVSAACRVVERGGLRFDLSSSAGKWAFARRAKGELQSAPVARQDELVAGILATLGHPIAADGQGSPWTYLRTDDVRELAGRGVEIGNHSARHVNLTRASDRELGYEVGASKAKIEAAVGAQVRYFSYPDGRFDRRVARAVARSHGAAMATWTSRQPSARYALRRYNAGTTPDSLGAVLAPAFPINHRVERLRDDTRPRLRETGYRLGTYRRVLSTPAPDARVR